MENPMNKWMIWGVFPLFLETPRSVGFFVLGISYELSRSAIDYGTGIRSLKSTQSWDFVIEGYFLKLNKPYQTMVNHHKNMAAI